jgi:hypothetical protein
MKVRTFPVFRICYGVCLFIACFLSAGCKSTPGTDWNGRIGNYTYDQAEAELGPPTKMEPLSSGGFEATWLKFTNIGFGYGMGAGSSGSSGAIGTGQSVGAGYNSKVLRLVFGRDNKLVSWSKNY